jgi:hypothetical protein
MYAFVGLHILPIQYRFRLQLWRWRLQNDWLWWLLLLSSRDRFFEDSDSTDVDHLNRQVEKWSIDIAKPIQV